MVFPSQRRSGQFRPAERGTTRVVRRRAVSERPTRRERAHRRLNGFRVLLLDIDSIVVLTRHAGARDAAYVQTLIRPTKRIPTNLGVGTLFARFRRSRSSKVPENRQPQNEINTPDPRHSFVTIGGSAW